MKYRTAFVSNSSSCSFFITNTSDQTKTLKDFALENDHLRLEFLKQYDWHSADRLSYDRMIESAETEKLTFAPGERQCCVFGDESGTVVGQIYDYQLRDGGKSENFSWEFDEFLR